VVIAGAGPTGLVLANFLGKTGIKVLLVETNASTVGEPRAVSIDDESLRAVQALDLLDPVCNDIVPGYGSDYLSPSGSVFLRVAPSVQPYGHPRRNAFHQALFEAQLREGLTRYAAVEVLFSCTMRGFTEQGDGVTVSLQRADGSTATIKADYLVGCDGAKSGVRTALGSVLVGDSLDERWLIVDLEASPAASKQTLVFCDASRPCIALPGPRLTRRYEFKVLPGECETQLMSAASVAALLASHGAAPGSKIVRKTIYHFHARIVDHWGRGRVWLAGDAAHLSPPFAGQGMNSGVRDARNLAWKLTEVLRRRLGPRLLDTYQSERRTHVAAMIKLALRMGGIMGPSSASHGLFTRSFFRLLGLWPAARAYFAEMRYKPPPRFDHGFIIKSSSRRHGLVGSMVLQPRLRGTPHEGRLLDDVLGEGFVLLGIDVDPGTLEILRLGPHWDDMIDNRLALPLSSVPQLKEAAGRILLIRPDRYVMAAFSSLEARSMGYQLQRLWNDTW